ncbi:MAG: hypothetical protein GY874_10980 [Desulfobacteraceae bacterium]|nr:hypothetical protein [Desulfobacteraceae bacterium]
MKYHRLRYITTLAIPLMLLALPALADDLEITGTISGTQSYDSAEGIIFDAATLNSTAGITTISTYSTVLKPGTSIKRGATLTVTMRDNDGLLNNWEMEKFGDLTRNPNDDEDGDGLTNIKEYTLGTHPAKKDTEADGMPDGWEIQNGLNPLSNDAGADPDSDGLSNLAEFLNNTDPNISDTDDDGMPDGWEQTNGLDPIADDGEADSDGDGYSNIFEYQYNTSANNADSTPPIYNYEYDDNGNLENSYQN